MRHLMLVSSMFLIGSGPIYRNIMNRPFSEIGLELRIRQVYNSSLQSMPLSPGAKGLGQMRQADSVTEGVEICGQVQAGCHQNSTRASFLQSKMWVYVHD